MINQTDMQMQSTEIKKTSFTGAEIMNFFFKKEEPKVITSERKLTPLQMRMSANLGYPSMLRSNREKKPILTIRREIN
jgi:hypothetical protein